MSMVREPVHNPGSAIRCNDILLFIHYYGPSRVWPDLCKYRCIPSYSLSHHPWLCCFWKHRVTQYIKPGLLDIRGITPNTKTTASELYSNSFWRITGKIKYSPAIIISGYGRSTTGIFRALNSYLRSTRDRAFLYTSKVSHKSFNKICNQQAWCHLKDIHMRQFVKRYVVSKVARNHICFVANSNDRGEYSKYSGPVIPLKFVQRRYHALRHGNINHLTGIH